VRIGDPVHFRIRSLRDLLYAVARGAHVVPAEDAETIAAGVPVLLGVPSISLIVVTVAVIWRS
jgi:hypothetical protein